MGDKTNITVIVIVSLVAIVGIVAIVILTTKSNSVSEVPPSPPYNVTIYGKDNVTTYEIWSDEDIRGITGNAFKLFCGGWSHLEDGSWHRMCIINGYFHSCIFSGSGGRSSAQCNFAD